MIFHSIGRKTYIYRLFSTMFAWIGGIGNNPAAIPTFGNPVQKYCFSLISPNFLICYKTYFFAIYVVYIGTKKMRFFGRFSYNYTKIGCAWMVRPIGILRVYACRLIGISHMDTNGCATGFGA